MNARPANPDAAEIRRAAWRVGLFLALATSALVALVLLAVLWVILSYLRSPGTSDGDGVIDVSASDLFGAAGVIGIAAIAVAALTSWYATTRATAPLARALRLQRRFVSDASHELRTPISVLDMRLQLLQRKPPAPEQLPSHLTQLRHDVDNLSAIVSDLLDAASLDHYQTGSRCDARRVITEAVTTLEVLAGSRDVQLVISRLDPCEAALPSASLRRAVSALLDNAIKHAPRGTAVRVSAIVRSDTVAVSVIDSGPGIRGISSERIFDRFARGAQEDPRTGRGIGLALVRDTAHRYGGDITLVDHAGPGAAFLLTLPCASPSPSVGRDRPAGEVRP